MLTQKNTRSVFKRTLHLIGLQSFRIKASLLHEQRKNTQEPRQAKDPGKMLHLYVPETIEQKIKLCIWTGRHPLFNNNSLFQRLQIFCTRFHNALFIMIYYSPFRQLREGSSSPIPKRSLTLSDSEFVLVLRYPECIKQ